MSGGAGLRRMRRRLGAFIRAYVARRRGLCPTCGTVLRTSLVFGLRTPGLETPGVVVACGVPVTQPCQACSDAASRPASDPLISRESSRRQTR